MNIDTNRLITEVHLRPPLWDLSCELYKDRDAKLKAWLEVCQAIIPNFNNLSTSDRKLIEKQVQRRWKTARDAYLRCKGDGGRKKYVYFDNVKFIDKKHCINTEDSLSEIDKIQNTDVKDELDQNESDENEVHSHSFNEPNQNETDDNEPYLNMTTRDSNVKSKKIKRNCKNPCENHDYGKEKLSILIEYDKLIDNDDMLFFYSLLPTTRTFTERQKILFRSEVLKKAMEISNNNVMHSSSEDRPGSTYTSESQDLEVSNISSAEETTIESALPEPTHAFNLGDHLSFNKM